MYQAIFLLLIFAGLTSAQKTEIAVPEEEDTCDLPWAFDCVDDLMVKLRIPNQPLEFYCSSTNYTINVCLNDILTAENCVTKFPRHGHFNDWRKPLNSALGRFCSISPDQFQKLRKAADCFEQGFFECLEHDLKTMGSLGILEVITAEMVPETCTSLDLKVEQCLQYDNEPECRLFVDTTLSLVKEFIEGASCKNQPAILVPLNTDGRKNDDCSDELELDVLGKCFKPMLDRANSGQMSEGLHWFCQSSNETLHCLVDLLINGCANLPLAYHNWLEVLGTLEQGFCGSPIDFLVLHNCWTGYYECFQNSNGFIVLADIFFNQITSDSCGILIDELESCLLHTELECQDKLGDIVQTLRYQFDQTSLCGNHQVETSSSSSSLLSPVIISVVGSAMVLLIEISMMWLQ